MGDTVGREKQAVNIPLREKERGKFRQTDIHTKSPQKHTRAASEITGCEITPRFRVGFRFKDLEEATNFACHLSLAV
jgi:hypothetical protein